MSIGSLSSLQSTFSAIVKQQRKATPFALEPEPEDKKDPTKKTEFEKALEEKQAEPIKAPEKPEPPGGKSGEPKTSDGKSGDGEFLEDFAQEIQNTAKKKPERRWKAALQPGSEEDNEEEDVFKMLGGVSGQRITAQRNANHQAMLASLAGPGGAYQATAAAAAAGAAAGTGATASLAAGGPAAFLNSLAATSFHNSSTVSSSSAAS